MMGGNINDGESSQQQLQQQQLQQQSRREREQQGLALTEEEVGDPPVSYSLLYLPPSHHLLSFLPSSDTMV